MKLTVTFVDGETSTVDAESPEDIVSHLLPLYPVLRDRAMRDIASIHYEDGEQSVDVTLRPLTHQGAE